MPTARFEADFSSFISAINSAQVAMVDMGKGADTVEARLNAMVDTFSGRELIQEASLMTIAIEKIGGVAALTGDELTTVGDKAAEAVDKLHALGTDVPEGLQKLADATKEATTAQQELNSVVSIGQEIMGGLGLTLGITSLIQFGGKVLDTADKIDHFTKTTGMSSAEVQKLMYIADDSGTHFDVLANAVTMLEQKMGSGNAGLQKALLDLGLGFQDFVDQSPYEKLLSVGEAMAKLDDSDRKAADGAAIFGKSWREVAAAINDGSRAIAEQAPQLSDAGQKALTDLEKQWKHLESQVLVSTGNIVGYMNWLDTAMQITGLSDADAAKIIDKMNGISEAMRNMKPPAQDLPPLIDKEAQSMDVAADAAAKMDDQLAVLIPHEKERIAIDEQYAAALKNIALAEDDWRATLAETDQATVAEAERLMHLGVSAADAATELGLLPEQIQAITKSMAETDAYQKAIDNIVQSTTDWKASLDTLSPVVKQQIDDALRAGAAVKDLATAFGLPVDQVKALNTQLQQNIAGLKKWQDAADAVTSAQTNWKAAAEALTPALQTELDTLIKLGVPLQTIATYEDMNVKVIQAHIQGLKDEADAEKLRQKASDDANDKIMSNATDQISVAAERANAIRDAAAREVASMGNSTQAEVDMRQKVIDKADEEANKIVADAEAKAKAEEEASDRIVAALDKTVNARNAGGKFTPGSPEEQAAMKDALAEVNASSLGQMVAQGTQNVDVMNQYQRAIEDAMAARGFSIGGGLTPAAQAAGASSGGTAVNTTVNVQGSALGTSQSIAAAVSQAMTQTLKSLGYSLPSS
jgi:hypothetical protein